MDRGRSPNKTAISGHPLDAGHSARLRRRDEAACPLSVRSVRRVGLDHRLPQGRHHQTNDRVNLVPPLLADARGRDGGVRKELAAGIAPKLTLRRAGAA